MEQHAAGVARLLAFLAELEALLGAHRIAVIDIGGGLSVNFAEEETQPSYAGANSTRPILKSLYLSRP